MTEHLVILNIIDGQADTTTVHHPAPEQHRGGKGQIRFKFDQLTWPPATWPSLCGQIQKGSVYNHAGLLEHTPVCGECEHLAAHPVEA